MSAGERGDSADLLLSDGFVVTMNAAREVLSDGAIAIDGGQIVAVGRSAEVEAAYPHARQRRQLDGALVHPGLVDAHEHTAMHLARGWLPDFFDLDDTHRRFEVPLFAEISAEDEHFGTLLAAMEMVSNGTTAFGDTGSAVHGAGSVDGVIDAANTVGIRARTGGLIVDRMSDGYGIPQLNRSTEECLAALEHQLSAHPTAAEHRAGCWVTLLGIGLCSDELLVGAAELAEKYRTQVSMHQSCYDWEVNEFVAARGGRRPIEHLFEVGLLGPNTSLVHMIFLTRGEIERLSDTGTTVVHCPGASTRNAMSAARFGLFPEMLAAGVPVGLGSDQGNSSDGLDVLRMAYLASMLHKEVRGELPALSVEQSLEMATIHGARVLGLGDHIGSLEVGKRADVVIHRRDLPEMHPPFDPINNLVLAAQSKSVDTVLIDGRPVVDAGRLTTVDAAAVLAEVDSRAASLAARMGYQPQRRWPVVD